MNPHDGSVLADKLVYAEKDNNLLIGKDSRIQVPIH